MHTVLGTTNISIKRNAYGFRDDKYFKLRLFALHDSTIQQICG